MKGPISREVTARIEEHLFGGEAEGDDVLVVIAHNRATLINRLEGMPEASPEPDDEMRNTLMTTLSVAPARLMLGQITCKRVRFSASDNRTYSAIRVDVPYEGNGESLRWHVQPDMMDYALRLSDNARLPQHWSLAVEDEIVSFYAILPPGVGDGLEDAEDIAAKLVPKLKHVMDVLESMRRIADDWNASIPTIITDVVSRRLEGIAKREAFLKAFRNKVASILLPSQQA